VLILLAAGGYALSHIADMRIMGGLTACGVFLLIIAIAGLVGTALHHQVTLFFVSLLHHSVLLFVLV
jgi:tetraspanin-13/31